jgi:hypothetical protein
MNQVGRSRQARLITCPIETDVEHVKCIVVIKDKRVIDGLAVEGA